MQGPGEKPAPSTSATDGPSCSRSRAQSSSFIEPQAPRPAWAASCATCSRWARAPRILDSMRFGNPRMRRRGRVSGVVSGISWYGNCFGCRRGARSCSRPSTRATARERDVRRSRARRPDVSRGDEVSAIRSSTSANKRADGSTARPCLATFDEHAEERRPTVQVGDQFTESPPGGLLEVCARAPWSASRTWARRARLLHLRDAGADGRGRTSRSRVCRSETGMTPTRSSSPNPRSGCARPRPGAGRVRAGVRAGGGCGGSAM